MLDEWSGISGAPVSSGPPSAGKILDYVAVAGVASSTGAAAVSGIGAVIGAGAAASLAGATINGVLAATAVGVASCSSNSTPSAIGASTATSTGVINAGATVAGTLQGFAFLTFNVSGVGIAIAEGAGVAVSRFAFWPIGGGAISAGAISGPDLPLPGSIARSTGTSTSLAVATSSKAGAFYSAGVAVAVAYGRVVFSAVGNAAGTSTANGTEQGIGDATATSGATALGVGAAVTATQFTARGACIFAAAYPPVATSDLEWIYVPQEIRTVIVPAPFKPSSDTIIVTVKEEDRIMRDFRRPNTMLLAYEPRIMYIPSRRFTVHDASHTPVGPEPRQRRIA